MVLRLSAVVCALVLALSLRVGALAAASAAPDRQGALAPGAVVALVGTPHLWIADGAGVLHWGGDTRALVGRAVDWTDRREVPLAALRGYPRGAPWLSAGLLKLGDPIYLVKWESGEPAPRLLHIRSIRDVELFGITADNYGDLVLEPANWEQRYGLAEAGLARGELEPAGDDQRPRSDGALFLDRERTTNSAGLAVDAAGGLHVAAAGYGTGLPGGTGPGRADYAYCPAEADCAQPAAWARVVVAMAAGPTDEVVSAHLALTPQGQPRLLLAVKEPSRRGAAYLSYWYAACDAGCTEPAGWTLVLVVDTNTLDLHALPEHTKRGFAVDGQGRPRFVFGSGTLNYVTCDEACAEAEVDPETGVPVAVNWRLTRMGRDLYVSQPALALTAAGQPRVAAFIYEADDARVGVSSVDYFACDAGCDDAANWERTPLTRQGSDPTSLALRLDAGGRPRLALYQGGRFRYAWCDGGCGAPANWGVYALFAEGDGHGADLVLDALGRPRLAFRAARPQADGGLGFGLAYAQCQADCESPAPVWWVALAEETDRLTAEFDRPPPGGCTIHTWVGGLRPALALDAAGDPRIAYDAEHWVTGCWKIDPFLDFPEFKAVRLVLVRLDAAAEAAPVAPEPRPGRAAPAGAPQVPAAAQPAGALAGTALPGAGSPQAP